MLTSQALLQLIQQAGGLQNRTGGFHDKFIPVRNLNAWSCESRCNRVAAISFKRCVDCARMYPTGFAVYTTLDLLATITPTTLQNKMISRTWITCLACTKPITARIQVGHELEQPVSFPCPNCGTEVQLTLILDEPPRVKIRWGSNSEAGGKGGTIVNIGAGFTIPKDKLHADMYFPSFDAPRPNFEDHKIPAGVKGPLFVDIAVAMGTLPGAADHWRTLQRALRFHRTGQTANLEAQLDQFWGEPRTADETLDGALFSFLMRFMAPNSKKALDPLVAAMKQASSMNPTEYTRLVSHYESDLKKDRFEAYSEILSEYFKGYGEFSQTLWSAAGFKDTLLRC